MIFNHPKSDQSVEYGRIIKVALLSALLSATVSGVEYLLYLHTGSLALKADAFHTGSDFLAVLLVLLNSVVFKNRRRWVERLSGLAISILIFVAAANVVMESWQVRTEAPRSLWLAMIAVITALVLTYTLSRYKMKVGREENFPLLVSEGRHSYMDALSSLVVLIGLVGQQIGIRLDEPAAIVVAVLVGGAGWTVLRDHAFEGLRRFSNWPSNGLMSRLRFAAAIGLVLYFASGLYTVDEGQAVLVQRWGRLVRNTGPGLHYRLPWPFETFSRHDVGKVHRLDIGASAAPVRSASNRTGLESTPPSSEKDPLPTAPPDQAENGPAPASVDPTDRFVYGESAQNPADTPPADLMVSGTEETRPESIRFTGDQYLIEVHLSVYYRLVDPVAFQFNLEDGLGLLKRLCEAAAMDTFGRHSLDAALGSDRTGLLTEMKTAINREAARLQAGVEVLWLSCLDLKPPRPVMPAFRMVSSAQEDRERYINQAHTRARMAAGQGQARRLDLLGDAKAYAINEKMKAEAESHRLFFLAGNLEFKLEDYTNLMYLETAEEILKGRPKLFLPPKDAPLYLDLRSGDSLKGMP